MASHITALVNFAFPYNYERAIFFTLFNSVSFFGEFIEVIIQFALQNHVIFGFLDRCRFFCKSLLARLFYVVSRLEVSCRFILRRLYGKRWSFAKEKGSVFSIRICCS